jgi:hypothetical protein
LLAAVAAGVLGVAPPVVAAPTADVIVVWAPGAKVDPIDDVARKNGAAVIDRSPTSGAQPVTAASLRRGIEAYEALRFDDAWVTLDEARALADRTGAAGLSQTQLADLFLYRGLVKTQQGDQTAAWDELITSVTIDPVRVLDPARFPPRVASLLERVHSGLADRKKVTLGVDVSAGCTALIDGAATSATSSAQVLVGSHWVYVSCTDRAPWGTRVEVTADQLVVARNAALAPPTDDEMLIQARTMGARAFVAVEVRAGVGTARLIGIDGRERDRRNVPIARDLAPLAGAVTELLKPPDKSHWYESKWAYAAGAAILAAAIAIPITALITQDTSPSTWTAKPVFTWP